MLESRSLKCNESKNFIEAQNGLTYLRLYDPTPSNAMFSVSFIENDIVNNVLDGDLAKSFVHRTRVEAIIIALDTLLDIAC